jgi:hypothetical protein
LVAGTPCQDCCDVRQFELNGQWALLAVCSDGAGSAKHAEQGSALVCQQFIQIIETELRAGLSPQKITRELAVEWIGRIRSAIQVVSNQMGCELRELAATFLGTVLLPSCACFFQIGDGAIVTKSGDHWEVVFWPQSGEYINTTNFLTDDNFDGKLEFLNRSSDATSALALFTDGLERLILQSSDRTVHTPFLEPMFQSMAEHDVERLAEPMRGFLSSQQVNDRTDDDKTLILAVRSAEAAEADATD